MPSLSLCLFLPLRWKEWWVSDMSAFNITVVLSYLVGSCLKVAVNCYTEDFMFNFPQILYHIYKMLY